MTNTTASNVAHKLKGYLTRLQSQAYMASKLQLQGKKEQAQEYLKEHDHTIQMMSTLIDEFFTK